MKTPRRKKRPRSEAPKDNQRSTTHQAAEPEDDRALALRHRVNAPAVADESESGGHGASGREPRDRMIPKRWRRLQTMPRKLANVVRHKQLRDHAADNSLLYGLWFSHMNMHIVRLKRNGPIDARHR